MPDPHHRTRMKHPLGPHARAELAHIAREPVPCCAINPAVLTRLCDNHAALIVFCPSPYPADGGRNIEHLKITPVGWKDLGQP